MSKIIEYILTLWIILTLNFFLPRLMPGDPFLFVAGDEGNTVAQDTESIRESYIKYYGLGKPIHIQYIHYIFELFQGNLGHSFHFNESVSAILLKRFPWTVFLIVSAVVLSTIIGVVLGSISAWFQGRFLDHFLYVCLILIAEIPAFLLALIFLFFFSAELNLFPLSGAITHFAGYKGWKWLADICHHAALPILSLTLVRSSGMYLLARNSMITVMAKDYIRTATAKGLSRYRILFRHIIKNAMLPIVTRIFLSLGSLVGGAILVENVFSYPGLGLLMREAVLMHDYPLIQGIFLLVTVCVLTANYLADWIYVCLDHRVSIKDRE
jgi:peptide/nickel transport system permease protein